jgi:hypothetical protein
MAADPGYVIRTRTRQAVMTALRAVSGPAAVVARRITPDLSTMHEAPADWRQGITAARKVGAEARRLMLEFASAARGDGVRWAELAAPLGIEVDEYGDPAEAAFRLVAGQPPRQFDEWRTTWRCTSCREGVKDRGPYGGPSECEIGHAAGCERHAREIAADRARNG